MAGGELKGHLCALLHQLGQLSRIKKVNGMLNASVGRFFDIVVLV